LRRKGEKGQHSVEREERERERGVMAERKI
jgi:hypothetical protein